MELLAPLAADPPALLLDPAPGALPLQRARVILNEPMGLLDYRIPDALHGTLRPGMAVRVPLGTRRTSAYVAQVVDGPHPDGIVLKDLQGLDPERPPLPEPVLSTLLFAASYYAVAPGDMLSAALPAMARPATARYRCTAAGLAAAPADLKPAQGSLMAVAQRFPKGFTVAAIERDVQISRSLANSRVRSLCDAGLLERCVKRAAQARQVAFFRRAPGAPEDPLQQLPTRSQAAAALWPHLPSSEAGICLADLLKLDPKARTRLPALERAGLAVRQTVAVRHVPFAAPDERCAPLVPTQEQAAVIARMAQPIAARRFETVLLHGVTGSGKTEVYLQVIDHALKAGRTALVLVPEIALTPQLGERFRSRFGDLVATFHSGLSPAERRDEWERVARGDATIGLGARSALFLPLQNVGVIIVDEEHESSFKQDETPRYQARDLSVYRGRQENAVVVLGSATPALETFHNAQAGRYTHLTLPNRVTGRALPEVECIPLAGAEKVGDGVFTERLASAVERTLSLGEQVILFLNRRGFAPYVFCHDCGHSYRCSECEVSLTLHRHRGIIMCHYCGEQSPAPDSCDSCHGHRVGAFGLGTERVEAEVRNLFGNLPTLRLDRDVVRNKNELASVLGRFRKREAQVLIGTQMVAKGHDFPGVTLVGVISADASLNFPDFRAAERTFQLLTQVAGRAGRAGGTDAKRGFVLVQAYETEHYAIAAAQHHDYARFVEEELQHRKELNYPPYAHLALLRFEGPHEAATQQAGMQAAQALQAGIARDGLPVMALGPAPAPLARLRGQWRFVVLLKASQRSALRQALTHLPRKTPGEIRRVLDVDPVSML